MTNIVLGSGTPIVWADTTDFNPTAGQAWVATRTHQIDLTSISAAAFRQGAKADLGAATWAQRWMMVVSIEPVSAPAATGFYQFWLGWSDSATAANNNPGNLSGSDAAYNGYGAASTDADEVVNGGQIEYVGALGVSADDDVHVGIVGIVVPKLRYVSPLFRNSTSVSTESDAVEMCIALYPMQDSF